MMQDGSPDENADVPDWCSFFSADEFESFCEAVDDALSAFGIEGQDLWDGLVTLASGSPHVDVYEFRLDALAAHCRRIPAEDWELDCFSQIDGWAAGRPQENWLTAAPFQTVAPQLDLWLTGQPPKKFEAELDHPSQPYSVGLLHELYAAFWTRVPALGDIPSIPAYIPNSAVAAWNLTHDDLLDAVRDQLRQLPPPVWDIYSIVLTDEDGNKTSVPLHRCDLTETPSTTAASWILVLSELAPVPTPAGTLLAVPTRDMVLLSVPEPGISFDQRLEVMHYYIDSAWAAVNKTEQLSPWAYAHHGDGTWTPPPPSS